MHLFLIEKTQANKIMHLFYFLWFSIIITVFNGATAIQLISMFLN